MRWAAVVYVLVVMTTPQRVRAEVRLHDNGYSGLVVAIDENARTDRCIQLMSNIKDLVRSASSFLYSATNQRAFFRDVTILVPSSWPTSCTGSEATEKATTESFLTADIRISGDHPVYGSSPWTYQWGLCGQPGKFIQVPEEFLVPTLRHIRLDRARAIVHEWAKYRWGVFEEFGYPGDPLYPSFYQSSLNNWTPTGCSNQPVAGVTRPSGCQPGVDQCTFQPFMNASNDALSSSLMYLKQMPQVRNFCDSTNHVPSAPTKQNLVCGGRSVWEVMQHHQDFHNGNNPPSSNVSTPPVRIRLLKTTPDRFFLLLESSETMRHQQRWDFVINSIRKLIRWDAPTGAMLGIGHFGSHYQTDRNMTRIPELPGGRVELANVPPIADQVMEQYKNWPVAIDGALRALGPHAPGATIIMVTGNTQNSQRRPTSVDIDYMIAALRQKKTRLVILFYPSATPGLALVATESGGEVITVPDVWTGTQTSISVFHALTSAYTHVLNRYSIQPHRLPVQVEDRQFRGDGQRARGSFLVDPSLGANTTILVMYNVVGEIGNVKLRAPGGVLTPHYMYPESTTHLQFARIPPTPGRWEYEIDNLAPSHSSIYVQVTSAPSSSLGTIRVEMWTNVDASSGVLNATRQPLIIYTSVMRGSSAIVDAEVYAVISRADGSSVRVQLLDNGLGVPDIMHGDGIYSRYFTSFGAQVGSDPLLLRIRSEVGGTRARMLVGEGSPRRTARSMDPGKPPCCGSTIGSSVQSVQVPDLSRSASAGDLLVVNVPGANQDIYPPSRITDLRAGYNATLRTVAFSWTAPGDDFDMADTKVARYEVRFSDDRDLLVNDFSRGTSVPHWTQPRPAGEPSVAVIDFNMFNTLLYFAIRGIDEAGNEGPVSNVVVVVVPPPVATTTTSPPTVNPQPNGSALERSTLLIILLCVAAILILIVLLSMYFFMCYRRSKDEKDSKSSGAPITSPYDRSRGSTPVKHPALSLTYDNSKNGGLPVISDGRTPIMWSASEILETRGDVSYGVDAAGYGYRTTTNNTMQQLNTSQLSAARSCGGGPGRYNSYQTPYAEDMPYASAAGDDGRSLVSTQPSESVLSLVDPRSRGPQHHADPQEQQQAGYCWHSDKDALVQGSRGTTPRRPPPPTKPKPRVSPPAGHLDCTVSSTGSDKKRRNVTQV